MSLDSVMMAQHFHVAVYQMDLEVDYFLANLILLCSQGLKIDQKTMCPVQLAFDASSFLVRKIIQIPLKTV